MIQTRPWRSLALIAAGLGLGLVGAIVARSQAQDTPNPQHLAPLVWAVISVPLGVCGGAIAAAPRRWTGAAGWSALIYFFSVFAGARLERLLVGKEQAAATQHALYFTLAIALQCLAGAGFAWWFARRPGAGKPAAER